MSPPWSSLTSPSPAALPLSLPSNLEAGDEAHNALTALLDRFQNPPRVSRRGTSWAPFVAASPMTPTRLSPLHRRPRCRAGGVLRHLIGSVRRRFADDPHASVVASPTTPLPDRRSAPVNHGLRPSPLRRRPPRVGRCFADADDPTAGQECFGASLAPSVAASPVMQLNFQIFIVISN